jgi:uncharacterized glyoxalase superfamily protein PhnB
MEAPKFTGLVPIMESWDMLATINFYTNTLGFRLEGKGEANGAINFAMLNKDMVYIIFRSPNEHLGYQGPEFSGQLYIYTSDVDIVWQFVQGRAHVVYPIESFKHGMREFAIRDNNGYILTFGKPIDV